MTSIVKYNDIISDLNELQRVAKMYAVSGLFAAKGGSDQAVAQIATQIMAGRELGIGPFASVQGIHVVQGRPAMAANLMAAKVKSHPRYNYKVREMSNQNVSIEFFEDDESIGTSNFSAEDAKKAGTKNTDKFPRNMLFARAMSNGVRWFCPDVFSGSAVYTPDELGATVDDDGQYIESSEDGGNHTAPEQETPQTPETSSEEAELPPPLPAPVAEWLNADNAAQAAYDWSVEHGAQKNIHAARNSMKKIVNDQFNGSFTKENAAEVLTAFYFRQHEHMAELADTAITEVEPIPA